MVTDQSTSESWSLHCSACGNCCNTPPQLSLPELFRHQHRFVGSLTIRRVKRLQPGQRLGGATVTTEDSSAFSALAERLLHRVEHPATAQYDFLLATQGFADPSLNRCPALGDDRLCTIHHEHKPATCAVVPLEALVPDRLQHLVLAGRGAAGESLGTDCIAAGERSGFTLAVRHSEVVDEGLLQALALRRAELAADKRWWGDAVFRLLQPELFVDAAAVNRIPFDGFLTIAVAPVLLVLAEVSDQCRWRCIEYLEAQIVLIEEKIEQALARQSADDRPVTRQLRAFVQTNRALLQALQNAPVLGARRMAGADEIEAWLGQGVSSLHLKGPSPQITQLKHSSPAHYSQEVNLGAARLNISPEALQTCLDAGKGMIATGVVRSLHATVKPGGSACNLDCTYCYYLGKEGLLECNSGRIRDDLLEKFIVDYIASQDGEEIAFTWHGGEPTLMGLEFFRHVVALQKKHTPTGRRISNDLQTNGTLLDDDWCAFLAENSFFVGLSIDGPCELHDAYRLTKKGASSFDAVFAAAQRLRKHGVVFSTLTTVNRKNALYPKEVYRFLRDEIGTSYMQFIPCVEPLQFKQKPPGYTLVTAPDQPLHPLLTVTDWSVRPRDWGEFLARIFDDWHAQDKGRVKINLFESMFAQLQGLPALVCTSSPYCGKNVVLEHDGRVYACDHYVYPEHEIGRIGEQTLSEMVFSLKQLEFGLAKYNSLPGECRSCSHLKLCWGECPRTRILRTRPGEGRLSYLCQGWKIFYDHALAKISHAPSC